MKAKDIEQGKTYRNKGAGRTTRTVVKIILHPDEDQLPKWWSSSPRPESEPVVVFKDTKGCVDSLYLRSFASWAGGEVSL